MRDPLSGGGGGIGDFPLGGKTDMCFRISRDSGQFKLGDQDWSWDAGIKKG